MDEDVHWGFFIFPIDQVSFRVVIPKKESLRLAIGRSQRASGRREGQPSSEE